LEAIDSTGRPHQYSFELAISQELRSDLPPVYPAQFAISDMTRGEFHSAQQSISKLYKNNTASTAKDGIDVQSGGWSIQGLNGKDHLFAAMDNYSIDLNLTGIKPLTLHNGNGLLSYGAEGFSYYYSRTRMSVAGTIIDHQQTMQVTGLAWMDHRWGNFITLSNESKDWYGLQLSNNTELMIYIMHDATGAITATYASYVDAVGNSDTLPATALGITVLGKWTSKVTGITYPSGWRLDINTPSLQATLMVMPISQNQEVTNSSTGNASWEGGVGIQGQMNGNAINGQGCVELTGYSKAS
jgi:predicted secreted hydrolase